MLNLVAFAAVQLDVSVNRLGQNGEAAIREAVRSKEGFDLKI